MFSYGFCPTLLTLLGRWVSTSTPLGPCANDPSIMSATQRSSRLSVEDYHRLEEFNENGRRTELIRGVVIEKMSQSPLHCTIVALLHRFLSERVPAGFTVRQEQPLTLADSEPAPDISITRGEPRDYAQAHSGCAE